MDELKIEIAMPSDVQKISELIQFIFGSNPKCAEIVAKWVNGANYHVTVAKAEEEIIGVAASWVSTEINLAKYEAFGVEAVNFLRGQKLGWMMTLAILPKYRQRKIGWLLADGHLAWLKSQGCTSLVGASWVTGSADNSSHMFTKAGFQELGKSNALLRADLRENGATCAACKKTECECTSVLYGLRLQ